MKGYSILVNAMIYAAISAIIAVFLVKAMQNPGIIGNTITGFASMAENTAKDALAGNVAAAAAIGAGIGLVVYVGKEFKWAMATILLMAALLMFHP